MRLEDMSYHYKIFEKSEVNGFVVVLTPMYCDIDHLRREYVKFQMFWFCVWIFQQDGYPVTQKSVLGYKNIDVDAITCDINEKLLKDALCIS